MNAIDETWVCYTAGVGEDASFDIELAKIGCTVVAIDPTPRAVSYMTPHLTSYPNLHLEESALWVADGEVEFFPPADSEHVSYSVTNRQHMSQPIGVPALTLPSLMRKRGHSRVDLVKLDIEGAEYDVVEAVSFAEIGARIVCIEFHRDRGIRRLRAAVRRVVRDGFSIAAVHRTDVTFLRDRSAS